MSVLVGVATVYAGIYVGGPLYCDCDGTMFYDDGTPPWIALDVGLYGSFADCGDEILLYGDGWRLAARALDAGPLSRYYVADYGPAFPIIADVPEHLTPFRGLSARTRVVNVTWVKEAFEP